MKKNNEAVHTPRELISELQSLVAEAQTMISGSASALSSETLAKLRASLSAAQERLNVIYAGARQQVVDGARCTDTAIRENPYQALAIAAGVGLLVGMLLGRRHD